MVSGELCASGARLVFVDEMGSNTSLHELYAYSPVVEGGANGAVFETYLQEMLLPALGKGDVVVMDNLSVHKSERVREMIEDTGASLLYLPPYSPDFHPIEEAFSKIKNLLRRKAGARVREALVEAIGEALSEVTEEDARAFFEHCGYREAVQLL
jgi:transposase